MLIVEIPAYAARPVAEQLLCKQRLNGHVAVALEGIPASQRIVLDTGAGIAITFLERALSALDVLRALLVNIARGNETQEGMTVHGALNLGPIRVIAESNAHVNILGDGISVAQRLLAFAKPDQILVAKTYVETALAQDTALASLFVYQGSRTDAHVRDHEVFELDGNALARPVAKPDSNAPAAPTASEAERPHGKSRLFAFAFAGLSVITLTAMVVHILERQIPAFQLTSSPAKSRLQVVTTPLRAVSRVEPVASRAIESATVEAHDTPVQVGSSSDPKASADAAPAATQAPLAIRSTPHGSASTPSTTIASASRHNPRPAAQMKSVAIRTAAAAPASERRKPVAASVAQRSVTAPAHPVPTATSAQRESTPLAAWQPVESNALPAASPAQPSKGTASALVTLAISPWGEVFVDDRSLGVSPPLREFELPVGKHRIVVRNGDFKAFEQELDLTSNQTVKVKHKFAQRS